MEHRGSIRLLDCMPMELKLLDLDLAPNYDNPRRIKQSWSISYDDLEFVAQKSAESEEENDGNNDDNDDDEADETVWKNLNYKEALLSAIERLGTKKNER